MAPNSRTISMMNPNDMLPPPAAPSPQVAPGVVPAAGSIVPTEAPKPQPSQNPYDFMLAPKPEVKRPLLSGGKSPKNILIIVGAIGLLVVLVGVIVSLMLPKGDTSQSVLGIAQQQQELMRIATQGQRQATSEDTKILAYNVDLSIGTSQRKILTYMTTRKIKTNEKLLALTQDPATDKDLEDAKAPSTYDSALGKVLATQLQSYLTDLQKSFQQTKNKALKQILSESYSSGKTLLSQAQAQNN